MYSGHRQRKSPQRYAPQQYNNAGNLSPGTMSNRMTVRNMQRALQSPRGIAMMQTLGLSPTPVSPLPNGQRVRRSLEDIVTKSVAPGDPGLTDLVLTEHISIAAVTLLSELAREFRVNAPLGTTIDIDTTLTYVLQALQELHPVQTVEQLEAAAAKHAHVNETPAFRPPAATPPPPPAATFEDMLVQAIKPASATSLATIASQSQVKVLDAISRAAHNTLPSGSRWWSDDEYWTHMRKACIAELDKLAPGYTAPSLAQLAAADRLAQPPPPNPSHSTQRTQGAMLYDGLTTADMQHLMTYDTQLQGVIGSALQFNGDDSDGKHERPVTARNVIPPKSRLRSHRPSTSAPARASSCFGFPTNG